MTDEERLLQFVADVATLVRDAGGCRLSGVLMLDYGQEIGLTALAEPEGRRFATKQKVSDLDAKAAAATLTSRVEAYRQKQEGVTA